MRPLVSQSRDGDLVAYVCNSFGINPFRGSSSRGGMKAILGMKQQIESGGRVAISPDGPRGPLRSIQPGITYLAQKSQAQIVPISFGARKHWVFGSWDEFVVPKPFNRISVVYGPPLTIGPTDDLEARGKDVQAALNAVSREADSISGGGGRACG